DRAAHCNCRGLLLVFGDHHLQRRSCDRGNSLGNLRRPGSHRHGAGARALDWSAAPDADCMCVFGAAYVAFMFGHDVPMYWSRWISDQERGRHYLSIAQGLTDVSHHRVVSYRWQDWKSEIAWMSLYFSVAVWVSISLVLASVREAKRLGVRVS